MRWSGVECSAVERGAVGWFNTARAGAAGSAASPATARPCPAHGDHAGRPQAWPSTRERTGAAQPAGTLQANRGRRRIAASWGRAQPHVCLAVKHAAVLFPLTKETKNNISLARTSETEAMPTPATMGSRDSTTGSVGLSPRNSADSATAGHGAGRDAAARRLAYVRQRLCCLARAACKLPQNMKYCRPRQTAEAPLQPPPPG